MLPLRVALPYLEPLLAENVAKEVRKDAQVIRCAAEALGAGAPPGPQAARRLLEAARGIDREFLARAGRFPVRIVIPYERIEPLRLRRIELGLRLAYRILGGWSRREKIRRVPDRSELAQGLRDVLDLYAQETQALSASVRLPALLVPLRERLAAALLRVMREIAADIASHKRS